MRNQGEESTSHVSSFLSHNHDMNTHSLTWLGMLVMNLPMPIVSAAKTRRDVSESAPWFFLSPPLIFLFNDLKHSLKLNLFHGMCLEQTDDQEERGRRKKALPCVQMGNR